jgi:antagonist of KipI
MSLTIIKPGLLDTLQDNGRHGYSKWGISAGGAMDTFAASVANYLTGNTKNAAVLEIHFPGPQILFEQNALIAITGADMQPAINGEPVDCWRPIVVTKNTVLQFSSAVNGPVSYLAVHGGFVANEWLHSYSTNLKIQQGGFEGRRLQKGDELLFGESSFYYSAVLDGNRNFYTMPWRANVLYNYEGVNNTFFILPGAQFNWLSEEMKKKFFKNSFTILPASDRMGYCLEGEGLQTQQQQEILSTAVQFGTIQLLPSGQLIVLMADHQTTGGYPQIAHVISAHLPALAQKKRNDKIKFALINIENAEQLLINQKDDLCVLKRACCEKLQQLYAVH